MASIKKCNDRILNELLYYFYISEIGHLQKSFRITFLQKILTEVGNSNLISHICHSLFTS